ncbi:hypothetical protein BSKO_11724 [Bryopsis sp. KO-2023]|nr:hypothetical protein BSKO_11724 [Bryopsis sp. KO-2023]
MPKTSNYYSAVERVQRGRPPKCRSDDSGLDASWKPDEDEIACELDDDEVTSDGKSAEEDEDDEGEQEEEREQAPRGRPARGGGTSERKGGPGRKKQPQEWKDNRKPTKGLRELQALIDGLHQDKRTRRQQPPSRRRYRNGSAPNNGKVADYVSFSSGDSSWSGSSFLGSSRQDQAGTSEPQKVVLRGAVVRRVKLADRSSEGFEEMRKRGAPRSHKKSSLDRSLEGVRVRVAAGGSAFPTAGGTPCEMRSFKSGGSGVQRDAPEQNPSKRQRLDLSAKESTDQGENGGAAENAGAQVGPSLSDGEEDLATKDEDLEMKHEDEDDGAGSKKSGRSTFKLPRMPMIKHEKAWYRARILKTERERVFVEFTGFEDGSLVKPFWIRKDSDRIWTGSYRGKDWKHLGDGAWQPKPPAVKQKKKPRGPRGRRRIGAVRADTEVTGRTKDSNGQGVSQEEDTNMETDDMDAPFNSNQNEHKSDAAVENSEVAQIPMDTGQGHEFAEVDQKEQQEAKPSNEEPETRKAGSGSKPARGTPRNGTSDTAPGNRDSGNNRREEQHGRGGNNKTQAAPDYARNTEEYESRMRNADDQSESGVGLGENNTADKNSGASTRGDLEGSGPSSQQQQRAHKGKTSLGVMSEGVGSGGDSQGSEACGTTSKKGPSQDNPVSQSDAPEEERNATGREGPDDAACSSPSSATPHSGCEKEEPIRAPADVGEDMPNPSNQEQEQIEQGDGIRRSARVAQLGWKNAWKRSNRGETRSGDDPDDPDDEMPAPRANRSLPHVPTHTHARNPNPAVKPVSRSQHLKRKSSVMIIDTSVAPRTRQLPPKKPATIDRGGQDSERVAASRGNHGGKGTDGNRAVRARAVPRTRPQTGGSGIGGGSSGAGIEEGADRNSLIQPPMGWTGGQPTYWMNGSSALSHIRKHLPYYSSHISDEKLESYVEMMERLDDVSWGDLPSGDQNQGATSQRDDKLMDTAGGVNGVRLGNQQPGASHHQQLNQFVPMPMGQPQSQSSNVQMPLPWTALSPLFYPSVVQFPNWMQNQQSMPPRHQPPPSAPSFPQKLNRNPGSGSGGSQ